MPREGDWKGVWEEEGRVLCTHTKHRHREINSAGTNQARQIEKRDVCVGACAAIKCNYRHAISHAPTHTQTPAHPHTQTHIYIKNCLYLLAMAAHVLLLRHWQCRHLRRPSMSSLLLLLPRHALLPPLVAHWQQQPLLTPPLLLHQLQKKVKTI